MEKFEELIQSDKPVLVDFLLPGVVPVKPCIRYWKNSKVR